ncbi:MAG TPA: hypothetical protein VMT21_09795 [Gemmatimonadales bacterium]|nr:hypothetical protein [Gemmatimonadales bacterium]
MTSPGPKDGRDVIRAMHDRYPAWYRTIAFTQHNTATDSLGREIHSVWREYAALPGRLRIDFLPADSGKGILFRGDTEYVFAHDSLVRAVHLVHPLLLLGFDVYLQPAETTLAKLAQLGFDLSILHEETWQGRPVYVVGAGAGDRQHLQFWVDRERLVFVRLLQPGRPDSTRTAETRFEDYREAGPGWLSARVAFLQDDQPVWLEEYGDIRTDLALDPGLFDPRRFGAARPGP